MRSLLFVPGNDAAKIERALSCGADVVLLDLEDSVAVGDKQSARETCAKALGARTGNARGSRVYVRINALDTGLAEDDLAAVIPALPDGLMLPKAQGGSDIAALESKAAPLEAAAGCTPLPVIAIATESARALFEIASYADSPARLEGLTWGAEDLSADLGATANKDATGRYTAVFEYARTLCLTGAVAAGVTPIDTVFVDYKDTDGLRRECEAAARDGFTAKLAIHPAQVEVINQAFTPSGADIERAAAVIAAFEAAGGAGVVGLDGVMLDQPHKRRAEKLLARAKTYGQV